MKPTKYRRRYKGTPTYLVWKKMWLTLQRIHGTRRVDSAHIEAIVDALVEAEAVYKDCPFDDSERHVLKLPSRSCTFHEEPSEA